MKFNGELYAPYQVEGVQWMLDREKQAKIKGGMLCDEMGLGKTAQTIATMIDNRVRRTLILVPKSVVKQWCQELAKFAPGFKVLEHQGLSRTSDPEVMAKYDVVVAPYSVVYKRIPGGLARTVLHDIQWGRIVLDEGHEIRNSRSKIHKAVCLLHSTVKWVITGTPVFNSVQDFVALCEFLGIKREYVQAYFDDIKETYVLRRTKEDLVKFNKDLDMPGCDFENVELNMYPEEDAFYQEVFERCRGIIDELRHVQNTNMVLMNMLECVLRCRQTLIHPQIYLNSMKDERTYDGRVKKMDMLFDMIAKHPDEKSIVFCQFIAEMDHISEKLTGMGIDVFRIDGSVNAHMRERSIQQFKNAQGGAVFIIQIKAGGQGLNLQEASRVYITTPAWNPATELQAIGRAYRKGQNKKVIVRKLVYTMENSIEESIIGLQNHKSSICAQVLNDDRIAKNIPVTKNGMNAKDIVKIFKL